MSILITLILILIHLPLEGNIPPENRVIHFCLCMHGDNMTLYRESEENAPESGGTPCKSAETKESRCSCPDLVL